MNWILILSVIVGLKWCSAEVNYNRASKCVEEFSYREKNYKNCSDVDIPAGYQWCSLDKDYVLGSGRWRYCFKDGEDESNVPDNIKGHPKCQFPFLYNNVDYTKCTKKDHHEYWCSHKEVFIPGSKHWETCSQEGESNVTESNKDSNNNDEWIVIQRRFDGSVSFKRTWTEYKKGFGDLNGEFWLGNDKLHQLTSAAPMKIRFDLWDADDNHVYAEYSTFSVASESDNYRLSIGGYNGTASDSLGFHNNMQFSTKDRDNDVDQHKHCSRYYGFNGWWFTNCYKCNLNGVYLRPGTSGQHNGITWFYWRHYRSLKKTIIKISYK